MNAPRHGQDGWELIDYSWDEDTGKARFSYTRTTDRRLDGRMTEFQEIEKEQKAFWTPPEQRSEAV